VADPWQGPELRDERHVGARVRVQADDREHIDGAGTQKPRRRRQIEILGSALLVLALGFRIEPRLARGGAGRGDPRSVPVGNEAVVVVDLEEELAELAQLPELDLLPDEDRRRRLGQQRGIIAVGVSEAGSSLLEARVVEIGQSPAGRRPALAAIAEEVAPSSSGAHELPLETNRELGAGERRYGHHSAVFSRRPDEIERSGRQNDFGERPFRGQCGIVGKLVPREVDGLVAPILELDPVGRLAVVVEEPRAILRDELR
jgi:hypothetical protein